MHGQGNYSIQVGQDPYARPPAFQQNPATTAPPTSHYGLFTSQPQVNQQGHPSFHLGLGAVTYQHVMTNLPHQHQDQPAPAQPYMHHPRPPHMSNHSYPNIEQQLSPWSQNVHQLPPPPPLGPSAYQLPPPPPLLPYSSSSNTLMSDSCGSSFIPVREHAYQQSTAPVLPPLPPPPPPPPPLPHSPPRLPPLPSPSPSSDILPNKEGNCRWKELQDRENLKLECLSTRKPVGDGNVHVKVQFQEADSGANVGSVDEAAHSLTDSDMDMEDDITYPEEEKHNQLSVNSNDEWGSTSQEDYTGEKPQSLQHTGGHRLSEISLYENLSSTETSEAKAKVGGLTGNGQDEISLDASIKEPPSQNKCFGLSGEPVVHQEPGYGELPGELMNDADPFKTLQSYHSNSASENENVNHGDVSLPLTNAVTTKSDAEKGHGVGSDHSRMSESNKQLLPDSMVGSPRIVIEADKLATPTGLVAEFSDRSYEGQKPVSSDTLIAHQSKDSSRNYDKSIVLEEPSAHKPDVKSDKLNVDEFGRLVREDISDSDSSDSPRHAWRHARRLRKRSRSQSRSPSPHDSRRRRRRRSPWRRKERRGRSRSFSPRRRSWSRSPVLRRDTEFSGDKLRWEKGQLPGCFDFLRGKCYRGATCRYSHHESDKSERARYNRGKNHNRDASTTLQSPDFDEGKVMTEKDIKDKDSRSSQDMPKLRDAKDAKGLLVDATSQSPDKRGNISGYPVHDKRLGEHDYMIPESFAKYSGKTPQAVDQQVKRTDDSLPSESSSLAELLAGISTRHLADRQDLTGELYSVENYLKKPYSNQEVPSWSWNPSIANHPSQLPIPLPSTSQHVIASFAPPILQKYHTNPPTSQNHLTPEKTCEAPVAYQPSHFHGPLKSVLSSVLPPPPPLPQPPPTSAEHTTSSQHMQQSLLPPWNGMYTYTSIRDQQTEMPNRSQISEYQSYLAREHDEMLHRTDGSGSSSLHVNNLISREGGHRIMDDGHVPGDHVKGIDSLKSFTLSQTNSLLRQSPYKGVNNSLGACLSSDTTYGHPYFQHASYGLQYSTGCDVYSKPAEPGTVSSSASRITQDFSERNRSYAHAFAGSKISNHFNPYASTFDLPLASKFSSNTSIRDNDASANTIDGTTVGLSSTAVDPQRIRGVCSKNMTSSSSVLPVEYVSRPGDNQYDPLFDSIEKKSNSSSKMDHLKHEITGDSDDVLRFHGSKRLCKDTIKQEGETAVSANDYTEKEECGETADMAVGAILNSSPSNPNDAVDMSAGEFEIDQVKSSGKKKKSKEKSAKLFKISIAVFVKEVLKPSWRQGNMSKEAFKTIVKKTVDKVSGAMKSHHIPKSQAKINHYIDSSRGKLTKLVMGYVDKYVKV